MSNKNKIKNILTGNTWKHPFFSELIWDNVKRLILLRNFQKVIDFVTYKQFKKRKEVDKVPGKSHGSNLIKSISPMAIELKLASIAFLRR
jgi:hypothetical protein